ncbi:MAG TPA: phosphoadenylyl-sulfate reductase [Actinomycetota bacterium]|nr:phosphoadenylyl-sulfate reductase [Actinomycetota bacterium]
MAATATTWPRGLTTPRNPPDLAPVLGLPADQLLAWAVGTYGRQFAVVTSFQAEGMVVLDLARQVDPGVRVLTLDTGRLPEETYQVIEAVRSGMGLEVEVVTPDPADVAAMVARHGPNLFHKDPALRRLCCHVRKVAPLDRALSGVAAWATGLRRDGGPSRADTPRAELDAAHGDVVKLNPLADWSRDQVWAYVRSYRLPVNPLYEQGYTSIGCAPCTRPTRPGEGERAGRWWWEADADRECGLHARLGGGAAAGPGDRFSAALGRLRADVHVRARETADGC